MDNDLNRKSTYMLRNWHASTHDVITQKLIHQNIKYPARLLLYFLPPLLINLLRKRRTVVPICPLLRYIRFARAAPPSLSTSNYFVFVFRVPRRSYGYCFNFFECAMSPSSHCRCYCLVVPPSPPISQDPFLSVFVDPSVSVALPYVALANCFTYTVHDLHLPISRS